MHDWNVVVTAREHGYGRARELLRPLGSLADTDFFNVLVMRVEDRGAFVEALRSLITEDPSIMETDISRLVVGDRCFSFQSAAEFESKARDAALAMAEGLANRRFHVRLHRRGFKGRLSSRDEERFLDYILLDALEQRGTPASITFDDPDAILVVETVSNRGCLSLWTREQMQRYPFLRLD